MPLDHSTFHIDGRRGKVRNEMFVKWGNHEGADFQDLFSIFREEVIEFSLEEIPAVSTEVWMDQLREAMGQ